MSSPVGSGSWYSNFFNTKSITAHSIWAPLFVKANCVSQEVFKVSVATMGGVVSGSYIGGLTALYSGMLFYASLLVPAPKITLEKGLYEASHLVIQLGLLKGGQLFLLGVMCIGAPAITAAVGIEKGVKIYRHLSS